MSTPPGLYTATIRSVTTRVAGPLATDAFAHHFGTVEQQVGVRAGDTLTYVHCATAASTIACAFGEAEVWARREQLPQEVSATWLGQVPGTYAPTLMLRFDAEPATALGHQPRRVVDGQTVPEHVWVRVGPVLWQICDRAAAYRLARVWSSCARLLTPRRPARARSPRTTPLLSRPAALGE